MEPIATRYTDKSSWGPGAWQDEPDKLEWRHSSGLPCLIVRSHNTGALCGYVGCPPGHPFHGMERGDVDSEVSVHGGLTYSDLCDEEGLICHVARPGEPEEVYWLGFDCGHCYDQQPGLEATLREIHAEKPWAPQGWGMFDGVYRDLAYVRAEVERLAEQVFAAGSAQL